MGWPIAYCTQNTAADDCPTGWFEESLECKQCSFLCADCSESKFVCSSCPTEFPIAVGVLQEFCFDKTESGNLCLCNLGWTWTLDLTLMSMTITLPDDINIDWDIFNSKESTFLSDASIKGKTDRGGYMKTRFNTKEFTTDTTSSDKTSFLDKLKTLPTNFNEDTDFHNDIL